MFNRGGHMTEEEIRASFHRAWIAAMQAGYALRSDGTAVPLEKVFQMAQEDAQREARMRAMTHAYADAETLAQASQAAMGAQTLFSWRADIPDDAPGASIVSGCECGAASTGIARGMAGHSSWCPAR